MKPLDRQQLQSAGQFQRQAARYGRGHILADTSDVRALIALIPSDQRCGPALDVATGGGHTALALARAGYRPVLADLSPAMLEQAAGLLADEGFPCETRLSPAEELSFPDNAFALVSCRVAPHHFSDVPAFVSECFRVLRPGGHLMIIDGSVPDNDSETADWLHRIEKLRDPSHGRFLDREAWSLVTREAGFSILHLGLEPMTQPDLEWYFDAADTSPENRVRVLDLVHGASTHVRAAMRLVTEAGPIRWQWQRLSLLARR